jgi:dTDP-4-amino-4,6-dideoxygalactose transaminase
VTTHGYNYRLDEIHAALGRCQLARLERNNARRRELVAAYRARLTDLPGWVVPFAAYGGDSAYHLMLAVAPDPDSRQEVAGALRSAGIQTSLHYPCIADFEAFARFRTADIEASRAFACRTITLPLFPTMTVEQVGAVTSNLQRACLQGQAGLTS